MSFLTPLQGKKTLSARLEYTEILWMPHYTLEYGCKRNYLQIQQGCIKMDTTHQDIPFET